jgi:hypothetical protein
VVHDLSVTAASNIFSRILVQCCCCPFKAAQALAGQHLCTPPARMANSVLLLSHLLLP